MLMFWLLSALLCLVSVAALYVTTSTVSAPDQGRGEATLAIYKDQLAELERDLAAGSLSADEAEAQRTEVSRRLLVASRELKVAAGTPSGLPKLLILVVPLVAALLYSQVGRFGFPDVPRQQRLAASETSNDWEALVARVEDQLEKDPKDLEGWQLLVPNYLNMGRFADAAEAMARIIELDGPTPERLAGLGEALVFANNGLVTSRSVAVNNEAMKLDPKNPKAMYYAALGLAQEGKTTDAKQLFQKLLAQSPADAPWRASVQGQLAKLEPNSAAPDINAQQVQDGQAMAPEDRMAMIRSMVDGLDEKLKATPDDIEGWLRLIRARTVLNENDKALTALASARKIFASKPEPVKLLDELARELKLQ